MLDHAFSEGLFKGENFLTEKTRDMDLIKDNAILNAPIAMYVNVERKHNADFQGASSIESVSSWLKEINPDYDPYDVESPYNINCGACAYAVYQRLNGNTEISACAENIGSNELMENVLGKKLVETTPEAIEDYLLELGEGAHTIVGVDRSFGPGHWFNAACMDGKVFAIDGQSGNILKWPPDYGNVIRWEIAV